MADADLKAAPAFLTVQFMSPRISSCKKNSSLIIHKKGLGKVRRFAHCSNAPLARD